MSCSEPQAKLLAATVYSNEASVSDYGQGGGIFVGAANVVVKGSHQGFYILIWEVLLGDFEVRADHFGELFGVQTIPVLVKTLEELDGAGYAVGGCLETGLDLILSFSATAPEPLLKKLHGWRLDEEEEVDEEDSLEGGN